MEKEYSKLGAVEARFAEIIWNNEPISSGELVKICKNELDWKKSTTYTVLKKLCDRRIFININGTISSLISKDEYYAIQGERFIDDVFEGSLPAFIASFTSIKKLTEAEIEEIKKMIESYNK